jgi:tetratricopeptide (TPR) repeat protein
MMQPLEGVLPVDEWQALGHIIDHIASEKPDLAEAIRLCAIPHHFDNAILAWLRGEGPDASEGTKSILEELKSRKLALAGPENLFIHDNVRNLLLHRWRTENPEELKSLNGKVAAYYEYKLAQSGVSNDQRVEWEREEMYHLLVADPERGIDRFKSLCSKAIDSYRLSTLDLLLTLAAEQVNNQTTGIQPWIRFFEGKREQVSSKWDEAIEVWEKLKLERPFFTGDLEPTLAVHLSILYKDKGKWDRAIQCLDESLGILEGKGDQPGLITILHNRGFLYKDRDDFQKAENDFQRAFTISSEIEDECGMAVSLKNLGLLYKDLALVRKDKMIWNQALERFDSSLAILERMGKQLVLAGVYNDRALLYKDRGLLYKDKDDLERAESDFLRAVEILESIGSKHEVAGAFNSLGLFYKDRALLYKDKENLQKAESNFQHAREILEKVADRRRTADIFNYLGFLYTAAMEWHDRDVHFQRALTNFQEALKILTEIHDERGTAVTLNNLGLLYQCKGEPQQAINYFQHSLAIVEGIGDEMNAATTMYELALVYDGMGDSNQAIDLLEKVVKISEAVGHPDSRIRTSNEKLRLLKTK